MAEDRSLLQSSFLLENADLCELASEHELKKKKKKSSISFDKELPKIMLVVMLD